MTESDPQNLLRQMLKALPEESRATFILEVAASLPPHKRAALLSGLNTLTVPQAKPVAAAPPSAAPPPRAAVPSAEAPPVRHPETLTDAQKEALLHSEMQQFSMQPTHASTIKRQVWSCLAIGLLATLAIVGLGIGGRKAFDWLVGSVDSPPVSISTPVGAED